MGLLSWMFGTRPKPTTPRHVRLQGDGDFDFEIVGVSRYQEALEHIAGGRTEEGVQHECTAMLVPEPSNPHAPGAVRVDIAGRPVGYLARKHAAGYRRRLSHLGLSGCMAECGAMIVGGWSRGRHRSGHFGVKLDLIWPVMPD